MRKEEYVVYGIDNCSWCERAKTIIEHYGYQCKYVNLKESQEIKETFNRKTRGATAVPQIFYYDPVRTYGNEKMEVHVGGYEELSDWLRQKTLYKKQNT